MFCKNCGNQIPDGAAFCDACGASTGAAEKQKKSFDVKETLNSTLQSAKSFFSKDMNKGIGNAAKSSGFEGAALLIINLLAFAFSVTVLFSRLYVFLFNTVSKPLAPISGSAELKHKNIGETLEFFPRFGVSLLMGLVVSALIFVGTYAILKLIRVKDCSLMSVVNLVGYASIPVTAALILNMIVGLIYFPITVAIIVLAVLLQIEILYVGVQKYEKLTSSPMLVYTIVAAIVIFVIAIILTKSYSSYMKNSIEDFIKNAFK